MPQLNSAVWRIVTLHGVAAAAVSLALPAIVAQSLHVTARSYEERLLKDRVAVLVHTLRLDPAGRPALPAGVVESLRGDGSYSFVVADRSGHVLLASGSAPPRPLGATDQQPFFTIDGAAGSYTGVVVPARVGAHDLVIEVAQNLNHPDVVIDDIEKVFRSRIIWLIAAVLLGLFGLDFLVVRAALRPIRRVSAEAQTIDARRLDVRLSERGLPSETRPLVRAINKALDRVEHGFRLQREFTADVAHELRTPLAVMRFRIDGMADPAAAEALLADLDLMSRVVDQLLALAELEAGATATAATADLNVVAERVVRHLAPMAIANGRELALTNAEAPMLVRAEPAAVFQALRNLVENALHHTPAGTTVEVRVGPDASVHVIDSGPGVPESQRELVFERFWRRDRRSKSGGAGLGLAIVARIARAYGGMVEVGEAPGGGADFALRLPRAS